jgi:molybdenum cofactor biosynthesis protein B
MTENFMSEGLKPPGGGRLATELPFRQLRIAVMTVSDTRGQDNDPSGVLLAAGVGLGGHILGDRAWVRDDVGEIQAQLRRWIADPAIDAVISTGGTGLTGRDVTAEAVRPLFDKSIDGFETVWHLTSYQSVGLSTMQSRACAGIAGGTLIFALPGSNGAVKDGWDKLIRWQLDSRHRPCNLVDLIPRFLEK